MPATLSVPKEQKEKAFLLYMQGLMPKVISHQLGIKYTTVAKWSFKDDWRAKREGTYHVMVSRGLESSKKVSDPSARLRDALRDDATAQVAELRKRPPKGVAELANTPKREGRATILKKLVESVSMIDDWDSTHRPGLVLCEMLGEDTSAAAGQVVDVKSSACVSDTPTGSVLDSQSTEAAPQVMQVSDSKPTTD